MWITECRRLLGNIHCTTGKIWGKLKSKESWLLGILELCITVGSIVVVVFFLVFMQEGNLQPYDGRHDIDSGYAKQ